MDSLGELVKAWRLGSGLSQGQLAQRIGGKVKYQNIQQLEAGQAKSPRYIANLAAAMGTTVEDLIALKLPPYLGQNVYAPLNHDREPLQAREEPPASTIAAAIRFLAETVAGKDEATREAAATAISAVIKRPERAEQFARALEAMLEEQAPEEVAKEPQSRPARKRSGAAR